MLSNVKAVQKTFEKVSECIDRLMELHPFSNENEAFVLLRASLWALRDRLSTDEAIHLGTQLPALLRGFYYEGWDMKYQSISRTKKEFLDEVSSYLNGHENLDLEKGVPAILKVVLDMIDQSEAIDVIHQLPKDIQELCPE
jgi:uncharacterized protein (DUF2267 family)